MSYILDALKKLEHEKSIKSRDKGTVNISTELLRENRPRPAKSGSGKVWGAILVAALVIAGGATWFFLKGNMGTSGFFNKNKAPNTVVSVSPPVPPPMPVPVQAAAPTPAQIPSPSQPSVTQPTVQTPPVAASPVVSAPVAPEVSQEIQEDRADQLRKRGRRGRAVPSPLVQTVQTPALSVAAPAVKSSAVSVMAPPPVDIKVSGIAWQDERSARRAVVNGMLMKEGSAASGAKITEIFRDRVRFTMSGSTFEIFLVASSIPGSGK